MADVTKKAPGVIEAVRLGEDDIHAVYGPDGKGYVVLQRMCKMLGLDANGQKQRLGRQPWATTCIIHAVAQDGKKRKVFCLHVDSVPMWLATITTNKVKAALRPKLALYQQQAAEVLARWVQQGTETTAIDINDRLTLKRLLVDSIEREERLLAQLREVQPKVESFDFLMAANGNYSLREAGKLLGLGGNKFQWQLLDDGYLFRTSRGRLRPYTKHLDRGLFKMRTGTHDDGRGGQHAHSQTLMTPRGLEFFRRKYLVKAGMVQLRPKNLKTIKVRRMFV